MFPLKHNSDGTVENATHDTDPTSPGGNSGVEFLDDQNSAPAGMDGEQYDVNSGITSGTGEGSDGTNDDTSDGSQTQGDGTSADGQLQTSDDGYFPETQPGTSSSFNTDAPFGGDGTFVGSDASGSTEGDFSGSPYDASGNLIGDGYNGTDVPTFYGAASAMVNSGLAGLVAIGAAAFVIGVGSM